MDAMNLQKKHKHFLQQIKTTYSDISFVESNKSSWNPDHRTIYYDPTSEHVEYSILHELGHMIAAHQTYKTDVELLKMELQAWDEAKKIAPGLGINIDQEHIEDCIDSYRAWLFKRSACPRCNQTGSQDTEGEYRCTNCASRWQVSKERFCRPYRKKQRTS